MKNLTSVEAVELVEQLWSAHDDLDTVIAILKEAQQRAEDLASGKALDEF